MPTPAPRPPRLLTGREADGQRVATGGGRVVFVSCAAVREVSCVCPGLSGKKVYSSLSLYQVLLVHCSPSAGPHHPRRRSFPAASSSSSLFSSSARFLDPS